jgi:cytochrome c553
MKRSNRLNLAAMAVIAAAWTLSPASARAGDEPPRIVTWECSGCHGIDGNGPQPVFPRLAGQSAAYMEQQLAAYRKAPAPSSVQVVPTWLAKADPVDGARTSRAARTYMIGPAHFATNDEVKAAASWYAAQKPAPGTPARDAALAERGRELFAKGVPANGVIACQDCHGARGEGLATFPRLAGQHDLYLRNQLRAFGRGERPHAAEMDRIAKELSPEDIRALAAYLASL